MQFEEKILEELFNIKANFILGGNKDVEYENEEHGNKNMETLC